MKKYAVLWLLSISLFSLCGAQNAFAFSINSLFTKSIQSEHRICEKDEDCALVTVSCALCGGEQTSVNGKFVDLYKSLGQCTQEEMRRQGEVKCVPDIYTHIAICKEHQCTVEEKMSPQIIPR